MLPENRCLLFYSLSELRTCREKLALTLLLFYQIRWKLRIQFLFRLQYKLVCLLTPAIQSLPFAVISP